MKLTSDKKVRFKTALFDIQDGLCAYCGSTMNFDDCTIDHILPLAKGGTWAKVNLTLSHRTCNQLKGSVVIPDWLFNDKPNLYKIFKTGKINKIKEINGRL